MSLKALFRIIFGFPMHLEVSGRPRKNLQNFKGSFADALIDERRTDLWGGRK